MSAHVDSKCNLILYYQDKRISEDEWIDATEISLSRQTAARANDTICGFFQVNEKWDRQLFKSAFSSDIDFDWFEFKRTASPDTILGIKISPGDREVIFPSEPEILEALDKGNREINVRVKSLFVNNDYNLRLDDLRGKRKDDQAIVALYNSESFSTHSQCSTNLMFVRTLQVIEGSYTAKL